VPKHFFVREIIEERKPLAATARRAAGSGQISCSTASRSPARFISCGTGLFAPRNWCSPNGKRRCS
jgi:hypothetical protein